MIKKTVIICILLFLITAICLGIYLHISSQERFTFKTKEVVKGDIVRTISATGTVNPVTIVNVGAQVSGKVWRLFADFNSVVKKGDIVAKIDPELSERDMEEAEARLESARANLKSALENISLAESRVTSADAGLKKGKADLLYVQREYERYVDLFKTELVSASERDQKESDYKQALAQVESAAAELNAQKANVASRRADYQAATSQVRSAEAALNRARANLDYTIIRSPVNGTVVSREVDEGQTLTARMQTPVLFKIAEDLTKMQVNASIDEADIGCIKEGQKALFTVDAFPYTTFKGIVKQVRISPVIVQNVVTYDVVIDVENRDLKLKPGMTSNVTVTVEHRSDVIKVPNEALRFIPSGNIKIGKKAGRGHMAGGSRLVWRMNREGNPEPVPIRTGMTDGEYTELVQGAIKVGEKLIIQALDRDGKPIISNKDRPASRSRAFRGFHP
ncbi:MAG: efflux RND transporter periplasmic adaptor subunit [Deltaproteobacteria bacterium]|nr:MAG: efflux RND transporter periplasmic adaptor subunit [Deltaproteobacteria bacterium]